MAEDLWGHLPRYFIVGDRPVKVLATDDGGIQMMAYDRTSGGFTPDQSYMSRIFFSDEDVVEVTESKFASHLADRPSGQRTP